MKKYNILFSNKDHIWAVISRDPEKPNYIIDTNEYLIMKNNKGLLTDPGGSEIFPEVFSAISANVDPRIIESIFSSHQDPDIISSLSLWLEMNPDLKCYVSWLWKSFIPHFGGDDKTILALPDEGGTIKLSDLELTVIPAHYLHSPGNLNLYDKKSSIFFSGDIGASLLPKGTTDLFVEDFDKHIAYMETFHKRWMSSNTAKNTWCDRVGNLKLELLCPQHGAIFRGEDCYKFIDWFRNLKVGIETFDKSFVKN